MTHLFGTVTPAGETYDLSFERLYPTSVGDVWEAVTSADRLTRWMSPFTGDLRLGGTWQALNDDGSVFAWGTVERCEAPRRFVTSWEYEGEHVSTITVTVEEHPQGALLVLVHAGLVDDGYGAGWQTYLEQLDDALGLAPDAERDPERVPGVAWEQRFVQLREPWLERIRSARGA